MQHVAGPIDSGPANAEPVNALDSQQPEKKRVARRPGTALDSQEKEGEFAVE
jgi:hypothetical protein